MNKSKANVYQILDALDPETAIVLNGKMFPTPTAVPRTKWHMTVVEIVCLSDRLVKIEAEHGYDSTVVSLGLKENSNV
jgi:hypothetical protein